MFNIYRFLQDPNNIIATIALATLLTPLLTTIANNVYLKSSRKNERFHEQSIKEISHRKALFENLLKSFGAAVSNPDENQYLELGKNFYAVFPYLNSEHLESFKNFHSEKRSVFLLRSQQARWEYIESFNTHIIPAICSELQSLLELQQQLAISQQTWGLRLWKRLLRLLRLRKESQ